MTARKLERAATIARDDSRLALDGIFLGSAKGAVAGAVIAPPHPLYGGSMDSPVVSELAYACEKAGIASLRFNWRGVGASAGELSGEAADADADYRAALAYLEETVPGPVVACGYSFGAAAALRIAAVHHRITRLVLVSPPLTLLDRAALQGFAGQVLVITGEHDSYAQPSELEPILSSVPRAALEVVPEADHFYLAGLAETGRVAFAWLERA
jgi:alpha/beta superfamily hydrolase